MFRRNIEASLLAALGDTPVVLLHGARQSGKTTLVRSLSREGHPARYLTLDDSTIFSSAMRDPDGFLRGLDGPVVLDEIQRAPGLFRALKAEVDRDRAPGRFLLTGSANVLLLPRLAETLVGRMEILPLGTLSQGEMLGVQETFIDSLFARTPPSPAPQTESRAALFERIRAGGFPEVVQRKDPTRQRRWFDSYITTLLQRDIRDLSQIEGLAEVPRLLSLLATRAASHLNHADLSRNLGFPQTTLKRYMALLQSTFLIQTLPSWSGNLGKRLVKSPKLLFCDTGLLCHLLGVADEASALDGNRLGPIVENFVAMEVFRQISWSHTRPQLFCSRTHSGEEVDLVLEDPRGRIVAIEIKAADSLRSEDQRGLRSYSENLGDRFHLGVLLYRGSETIPLGKRLIAMPISSLWAG